MAVGKKGSAPVATATRSQASKKIDKDKKKKKVQKLYGPPKYGGYVQKAFKTLKDKKAKFANLTISANALTAEDLLIDHMLDLFTYNAEQAGRYAKTTKDPKSNNMLQLKHVRAAVEAALSGRLATKAVNHALKAVDNYNVSKGKEAAYEQAMQGAEADAVAMDGQEEGEGEE
jgi:hypothetical protein